MLIVFSRSLPRTKERTRRMLTIHEERAMEHRLVVPTCFGERAFFEKNPPLVTVEEKMIIADLSEVETKAQLARDVAGVMRLWETALVLAETKGDAGKDLARAREKITKLKVKLAKADSDIVDLKGKQENFVEQSRELRETKEAMVKLEEELKSLKLQLEVEQKEKDNLKSAMVPAVDETNVTEVFNTRAELVKEIITLRQDTIDVASYAFSNAVEQLKIVNSGVDLVTDGTGMLYQVKDGQIVVPEVYQQMEDEDMEDEEDDHQE
jgi:hypothetical protein